MDLTYKLTLTEQQYNHIITCVEACHRIACGQLEGLNNIIPYKLDLTELNILKAKIFPELSIGESYDWQGGYANRMKQINGKITPFEAAYDVFQAQGYQIYRTMEMVQARAKKKEFNTHLSDTLSTPKADAPKIRVVESRNT